MMMERERRQFVALAATGAKFVTPDRKHLHMPREAFIELLSFNGFQCCHICSQKGYLLVDHDHKTLLIRGLLCNECNRRLGQYEHGAFVSLALARRSRAYLENTPCQQLGMTYLYDCYYPEQKELAS